MNNFDPEASGRALMYWLGTLALMSGCIGQFGIFAGVMVIGISLMLYARSSAS